MIEKINHKKWISTEEIEVLKHDLNFSNWTEIIACKGYWKIKIEDTLINIYMPTPRIGEDHSGFWKVFTESINIIGNDFQSSEKIKIEHLDNNECIFLDIFGETIQFEKD